MRERSVARQLDKNSAYGRVFTWGEVELVGGGVRGVAVHEAARIIGKAGADEILVSDLTKALASSAGLEFDDRGTHELKGLTGECDSMPLLGSADPIARAPGTIPSTPP